MTDTAAGTDLWEDGFANAVLSYEKPCCFALSHKQRDFSCKGLWAIIFLSSPGDRGTGKRKVTNCRAALASHNAQASSLASNDITWCTIHWGRQWSQRPICPFAPNRGSSRCRWPCCSRAKATGLNNFCPVEFDKIRYPLIFEVKARYLQVQCMYKRPCITHPRLHTYQASR